MVTSGDVATFIRITGAPDSVAFKKLKEHRGNLKEALDAHFREEDRLILSCQGQNLAAAPLHNNPGAGNQNPLAQSSASRIPDAEIEEQMFQAALQNSMMETEGSSSEEQIDVLEDSSNNGLPQSHSQHAADDLACAISMSLEDDKVSLRADEDKELNSPFKVESYFSEKKKALRDSGKMAQIITITVRMPDGRLLRQCFLKTDKLQELFDLVDDAAFQEFNFATYILVKQFPRRDYSIDDRLSTFDEVGLSNDETLFLEWI